MRILISFIFFFCSVAGIAQRPVLQSGASLATGPLEGASIGVYVVDLVSGETLFAENPEMSMVPASTMKVITGQLALDQLGTDFRFRTTLAYTGKIKSGILEGDLVWSGDGDPTFGNGKVSPGGSQTSIFKQILDGLRSSGIRKVQGKLVILDTLYRGEKIPRYWLWEDISNYYGAGVHGFNFMGNRYGITFDRSHDRKGVIPVQNIHPRPPGLSVSSQVVFGPKGSGDQAYVFGGPFSDQQVVRGTIPPGDGPFTIYAANHDPASLAGEMLLGFLRENRVVVDSGYEVIRMSHPDLPSSGMTGIHTHESPSLGKVISWMLSESDNLVAEALLKKCAESRGLDTRTDLAAKGLSDYMHKISGEKAAVFYDGSGLSPMNRLSARAMVSFLDSIHRKNGFVSWLAMMPEGNEIYGAAVSIPDVSCLMHTYLKTGSMTNVQNYAGYMRTRQGSLVGIAAFFSDFKCSRNLLRKHFFDFIYELCAE